MGFKYNSSETDHQAETTLKHLTFRMELYVRLIILMHTRPSISAKEMVLHWRISFDKSKNMSIRKLLSRLCQIVLVTYHALALMWRYLIHFSGLEHACHLKMELIRLQNSINAHTRGNHLTYVQRYRQIDSVVQPPAHSSTFSLKLNTYSFHTHIFINICRQIYRHISRPWSHTSLAIIHLP